MVMFQEQVAASPLGRNCRVPGSAAKINGFN